MIANMASLIDLEIVFSIFSNCRLHICCWGTCMCLKPLIPKAIRAVVATLSNDDYLKVFSIHPAKYHFLM